MDVDACLQRIKDAIADGDEEEANYARHDLRERLAKGGPEPSDPNWREWY